MKLSIQNSGLKSHKDLVITGRKEDVELAVEKINAERLHYKMDYADFEELAGGKARAEYIAHKSDHHKAAEFIRSFLV